MEYDMILNRLCSVAFSLEKNTDQFNITAFLTPEVFRSYDFSQICAPLMSFDRNGG